MKKWAELLTQIRGLLNIHGVLYRIKNVFIVYSLLFEGKAITHDRERVLPQLRHVAKRIEKLRVADFLHECVFRKKIVMEVNQNYVKTSLHFKFLAQGVIFLCLHCAVLLKAFWPWYEKRPWTSKEIKTPFFLFEPSTIISTCLQNYWNS